MSQDNVEGGEEPYVSIPRGGPIFVPDTVGPLTRVPEFETLVFQELQGLKEEVSSDFAETCDDEISVDELKIFNEEELLNKAFEEAFKEDDEFTEDSSQVAEVHANSTRKNDNVSSIEQTCLERSEMGINMSASNESSNCLPPTTCNIRETKRKISQKRRRQSNRMNHSTEESYAAKVDQFARIKQKQEEDKLAARLHSFNGSCGVSESGKAFSKKDDRIRSLKSTSTSKVKSSNTRQCIPVHFPEVILCFEVYHNRHTWQKTQEFLVLGRQFLTEVRDKIYCLTDEIMKKAGLCDPSGYFLIEDVFCNDMREFSAVDYSKPILDWLENSKDDALEKWECIISGELQQKQKAVLGSQKVHLPGFKSVHMQKTRFCDLRFRLGAGYLYCHQGDCKHLIVIRDMRLIHPEDVQNRAGYPLLTFQSKLTAEEVLPLQDLPGRKGDG